MLLISIWFFPRHWHWHWPSLFTETHLWIIQHVSFSCHFRVIFVSFSCQLAIIQQAFSWNVYQFFSQFSDVISMSFWRHFGVSWQSFNNTFDMKCLSIFQSVFRHFDVISVSFRCQLWIIQQHFSLVHRRRQQEQQQQQQQPLQQPSTCSSRDITFLLRWRPRPLTSPSLPESHQTGQPIGQTPQLQQHQHLRNNNNNNNNSSDDFFANSTEKRTAGCFCFSQAKRAAAAQQLTTFRRHFQFNGRGGRGGRGHMQRCQYSTLSPTAKKPTKLHKLIWFSPLFRSQFVSFLCHFCVIFTKFILAKLSKIRNCKIKIHSIHSTSFVSKAQRCHYSVCHFSVIFVSFLCHFCVILMKFWFDTDVILVSF